MAVLGIVVLAGAVRCGVVFGEEIVPKVLVIAGPCDHPPGTHEAAAGARLLKHCLENPTNRAAVSVDVLYDWPRDPAALDGVASIVFIGDIFPPERMEDPARVKAELAALLERGCGLVCLHYATGLRAQHVAEDGDHPLLHWLGGYFATGGLHHRSVTKVCTATLVPEQHEHPILRGWKTFTIDDEPYWNNYFGKDGPAANVTPLVSSMLPPESPQKETVAWAVERADGGRGVGIVFPHFFRNWQVDDLRMLVLNGICWSAKVEIPAEGVQTTLPDLDIFRPASVEPRATRP
jgi:hypothetical protein